MMKDGKIIGLHASPPCETYTDARWLPAPEGRSKPRPLRDYSFPWGFEALDFSELRQLRVGNVLFLLVRLECLVGFLKSASTFRGPFDELGGVDTSTGEWKTARPKRSLRLYVRSGCTSPGRSRLGVKEVRTFPRSAEIGLQPCLALLIRMPPLMMAWSWVPTFGETDCRHWGATAFPHFWFCASEISRLQAALDRFELCGKNT